MITGPGPGIVARPIPTAVGPFPRTVAIGTPTHGHVWMPATPVTADIHPLAIRRKRCGKIGRAVDLNAR